MSNSPTEHQGQAHDEWRLGATCGDCQGMHRDNRERVYSRPFYAINFPGGARSNEEARMHLDWDKTLTSYQDAKADGLQPYSVTPAGIKRAQDEVTSQEKALKVAKHVGFEFKTGTKIAPGVDPDLLTH